MENIWRRTGDKWLTEPLMMKINGKFFQMVCYFMLFRFILFSLSIQNKSMHRSVLPSSVYLMDTIWRRTGDSLLLEPTMKEITDK